MLLYLNQTFQQMLETNPSPSKDDIKQVVLKGASLRVRPVMMTASTIIVGLLPIMFSHGTGSEVMSRIAAPMVGGMISALLLTLLVLPVVYLLWRNSQFKLNHRTAL